MRTEHRHYNGVGFTLEKDHAGLWWTRVLCVIMGPYRDLSGAEARAQELIDSREGVLKRHLVDAVLHV